MNLNHLKRDIIQATQTAYTGHVPSALSVLDIIYVLYHNAMQDGDRFVLSKGHAALALYSVLADMGTITRDALFAFGAYDATCGGHPDACKVPGVEFSTGSLGHGLGMAAGLACGLHGPRVFCLIGDGEMQEGATIEALRLIGWMALPVTVILDNNGTHPNRGAVEILQAYGFVTVGCDGHNHDALTQCLEYRSGPLAVIADTIKGNGIARMVADPAAWHSRAPTAPEAAEMLLELTP